jgi:hypothetical protein
MEKVECPHCEEYVEIDPAEHSHYDGDQKYNGAVDYLHPVVKSIDTFRGMVSKLIYPDMTWPLYNTRDNIFKPLSTADFINMIHRYYKGEKTANLMKEYGVSGTPQKFTARLPDFYSDEFCPYCEMPARVLIRKGSARNQTGCVVLSLEGKCERCGHKSGGHEKCRCENCDKAEKNALQEVIDEMALEAKDDSDYQQEYDYLKFLLMAVLRSGQDENDLGLIHPHFETISCKLAPDTLAFDAVGHLARKGWLRLSGGSSADSIRIKNGRVVGYIALEATYRLNVNNSFTLIGEVMNPELSIGQWARKAWIDIAFYECREYLKYLIKEYRLNGEIGPKTEAVLRDGLESFSTSQMFNFIWGAVKDAAAFYQKGGVTKSHAANIIPGSIQRKIDRSIAEGFEVKGYGRNYNLPQSIMADILFNKVLKIGEKGFTACPTSHPI